MTHHHSASPTIDFHNTDYQLTGAMAISAASDDAVCELLRESRDVEDATQNVVSRELWFSLQWLPFASWGMVQDQMAESLI